MTNTKELRAAKKHINNALQIICKTKITNRQHCNHYLSIVMDRKFRMSDLKTLEECRTVYKHILKYKKSLWGQK